MALIRPRLNDFYNLPFTQNEVDFAIPFLDEDLPLYLDPFLLWKSPSMQDNSLHTAITNSFNHLGYLWLKGNEEEAVDRLVLASECDEVGLGDSKKRQGTRIGKELARTIIGLYDTIPQVKQAGFIHFEEIQLLVDNVGKDRVSDIACSFAKSFLIDYTIEQCEKWGIPITKSNILVYDYKTNRFGEEETYVPQNPETGKPVILVPKRWLRLMPWINFDDYFSTYFSDIVRKDHPHDRVSVLTFNRANYDVIQVYTKNKERSQGDCKNDPLFRPIPVLSAKRKLKTIINLPCGKENNADKTYEDTLFQLMASLLYPHLDFADAQSRTDSGVLIRDLIFYNNRSYDFLRDIWDTYECHQIVMELKNVAEIDRTHINQLNRYMNESFGRFGVIITRNRPPRKILQNTIDLWAGQRRCIIILTDEDIAMMCELFESKQRLPIDILKKDYIEFQRKCPG